VLGRPEAGRVGAEATGFLAVDARSTGIGTGVAEQSCNRARLISMKAMMIACGEDILSEDTLL